MENGNALMARPKKGAKKSLPADERSAVIHLKGTAEYVEWLERLHRKTHIPKAILVRLALAEYAERHGHDAPPER
jgi:hypothetical protein